MSSVSPRSRPVYEQSVTSPQPGNDHEQAMTADVTTAKDTDAA